MTSLQPQYHLCNFEIALLFSTILAGFAAKITDNQPVMVPSGVFASFHDRTICYSQEHRQPVISLVVQPLQRILSQKHAISIKENIECLLRHSKKPSSIKIERLLYMPALCTDRSRLCYLAQLFVFALYIVDQPIAAIDYHGCNQNQKCNGQSRHESQGYA